MEFSSFTLILTEKCNFDCLYCFQERGEKTVDVSTIKSTLDFFWPYIAERCQFNFTGGEPLLAFDQIEQTVDYIQKKNRTPKKRLFYTLTTNGSLINDRIFDFLKKNDFSLTLSFDGYAQNLFREKGSFRPLVHLIKKLLRSNHVELEINSVFTPETVVHLAKSMQFLMELGVSSTSIALDEILPWDSSSLFKLRKEFESLGKAAFSFYRKTKTIPLVNFRRDLGKGVFTCDAGKDRLALAPDGRLWGCYLFSDYFKGNGRATDYRRYCFGEPDAFIEDYENIYPRILANYTDFSMEKFHTDDRLCEQCSDLEECWVCPIDAAFSSSSLGKIPTWTCEIRRIFRAERGIFRQRLKGR